MGCSEEELRVAYKKRALETWCCGCGVMWDPEVGLIPFRRLWFLDFFTGSRKPTPLKMLDSSCIEVSLWPSVRGFYFLYCFFPR